MTAYDIWEKYQKGLNVHRMNNIYSSTDRAYNFYEDRQWVGLESGGEEMPFYNYIKPIVKFKTSSIAMNDMSIVYTPMESDEISNVICEVMNSFAAQKWEDLKMNSKNWELINNANIAGDWYAYFYDGVNAMSLVSNTDIMFADETTTELQDQKYIIVVERRYVEDVKEVARANGIDELEISSITADQDPDPTKVSKEKRDDKVTSILYMWKEDEEVHFCRSVENLIYEPDAAITGLKYYPLAGLVIGKLRHSARGSGEVKPLIPNQIEINKNIVRRSVSIKQTAFPKIAYDEGMIEDIDALDTIGSKIRVKNMGADNINKAISYLTPGFISNDAKVFGDEMLSTSKELAGAGDAALGNIKPEQASGAAIIAVRDQSAIPLNESISAYKQYVEDVAKVWLSMWMAYNPDELQVPMDFDGQSIIVALPTSDIPEVKVKVDVSPSNPFSKFAQSQSIDNLLNGGLIQFEEYVELLDNSSILPKNKLKDLLERRNQNAMQQVSTGYENSQGGEYNPEQSIVY